MNYDYDTPVKIISLIGTELPEEKEKLYQLIKFHNLNHGDIIRTTDFRELDAHIVYYNESEEIFELVINPDESDAGYLTIPLKITKPVKSALKKYKSLLEELGHFDLFLAPTDEFIKLAIEDLPEDSRVLLLLDDGYISMALIFKGDNSKSERTLDKDETRRLNDLAHDNDFL
jgi:hypothetical protein